MPRAKICYKPITKSHPTLGRYATSGTVPGNTTVRWPNYNYRHVITSEVSKTDRVSS